MQVYSSVFLWELGFAAFHSFLHFLKLQPLFPSRMISRMRLEYFELQEVGARLFPDPSWLELHARLAELARPVLEFLQIILLFLLGCFVAMFIFQTCIRMLFGPTPASNLLVWVRNAVQSAAHSSGRDNLVANNDPHQHKGNNWQHTLPCYQPTVHE